MREDPHFRLCPFSISFGVTFLLLSPLVNGDSHCFKFNECGFTVQLFGELVYCWLKALAILCHPNHCIELASERQIHYGTWVCRDVASHVKMSKEEKRKKKWPDLDFFMDLT